MNIQKKWKNILSEIGTMWVHDGNAIKPHAVLTSGKHSDAFFNISRLLERPHLVEKASRNLLYKMLGRRGTDARFVGPAMGAITIAHECARQTKQQFAFAEKVDGRMAVTRFAFGHHETIIPVEDVMTTGASTLATIDAALEVGGELGNVILSVVNRSGREDLFVEKVNRSLSIISLITIEENTWPADECPLCKAGSLALKPKTNWEKFSR